MSTSAAPLKKAALYPCSVRQAPSASYEWQQLICAHVHSGANREAIELYQKVQDSIKPTQPLFLSLLKACAGAGFLKQGRHIHNLLIRNGYPSDGVIGNTLINMYAKCGTLCESHKIFNTLSKRSAVSWSAIISGYVQHGEALKAIELFDTMQQQGVKPSKTSFLSTLKACGSTCHIEKGRLLHDQILRSELRSDIIMGSTILDMYAKCGSLHEARKVFDGLPSTDVVSWNALLAGYSQNGEGHLCLECYEIMQQKGFKPTKTTFICTLKACTHILGIDEGRLIHDQMIRMSVIVDEAIASSLICMYGSCRKLLEACSVFDKHSKQIVNLWSVMISMCVQQGRDLLALELFDELQCSFKAVDKVSYLSTLKACGNLKLVVQGEMIHDQILRNSKEFDVMLGSALVDMYCNCGLLEAARVVFDRLSERNEVSWGAMIAGYAEHGHGLIALNLYKDMQNEGVSANRALFLSTLKACSSLADILEGRLVHDHIFSTGLDSDVAIESTLVDMYAKCEGMKEALFCLNKMKTRDMVPWNAMMAGCTQYGLDHLAFELFEKMLKEKVEPDEVTILCLLEACSKLGAIGHGISLHTFVVESTFSSNVKVGSNLVDMYAKCGRLDEAKSVFSGLPKQDVVAWSALIGGYAEVGDCTMMQNCFECMLQQGWKPDSNTFSSLLAACSHAGNVEEGYRYFNAMKQVYGVTPTVEHFNCMIGLLAHAGCLEEATKVLNSMPMSPDTTGWLSLILACKNHGTFLLGSSCFEEVVRLDQSVASGYALMSSMYADRNM